MQEKREIRSKKTKIPTEYRVTQKLRQCVSQCACNLHGRAFAYSKLDCCDFAEIVCFGFGFSNILLCTYALLPSFFNRSVFGRTHYTLPGVSTREAEEEETKMLLFSLPCLAFIWIGFSFCSSIRAFHGEYILFAVYLLYCRN